MKPGGLVNGEMLLLSLPDELLLTCIAHISRLYYPILSLVSKRFRSLVASPELYKARSLLNLTESGLYMCVNIDHEYLGFTLCPRPNHQTLANDYCKLSGYVFVPVPIPRSPRSSASILDCRSQTWTEAPSLPVKVELLCVKVVDKKKYVLGRYNEHGGPGSTQNLVMVLDTKTNFFWKHMSIPYGNLVFSPPCIDGKFEGRMDHYLLYDSSCVKEYPVYSVDEDEDEMELVLSWFDSEVEMYRNVRVSKLDLEDNAVLANVVVFEKKSSELIMCLLQCLNDIFPSW